MSRLISQSEEAWRIDIDRVEVATRAVIRQVLGDGGQDDFRQAVSALGGLPNQELWLVELCCEAALAANNHAVRAPCGIRRSDHFS